MLNMGANNILCSLLGLLVIIGLTAGRSVIQHNFRENLYGAGYRRNPFISYAQEEPKPYNEENVVPYPYNLLSSSRPTEQTTPMEIHLKIAIPAFKVQLVNNEAQRNFLPFSMPPYYETPRYSPFGPIPLPIVRHLTYEDERQSVKRPENFGYADPDNIPNFLQRPLTAVFDLDSLLSKGLALEAVDSDQDELIDNILIKNIESAVDDDDDKYKNAENFQEDDVTEDSNTEDFDEFFKRLFGEIELITSNNENDNERIRYDIEPQDDTSKDSAESNEKNEEPIQDNSEVFIETLTNEPELKVPVNVDGNEDDDGVTTTIVYFETADSNEWNSIEENSEEFIENLTDAPELKVPVNADNDERTTYNFKPDDGASKESNESNEKNEEPIQENVEVFIETLPNVAESKVPVKVDEKSDEALAYFKLYDGASKESVESNENKDEAIETAKTNDVQPIDANDESQINLHTENDNVESKSLDELLNLMYREYGLKLEWKLNDIVKEDAGDIETVTVSDVKEDPEYDNYEDVFREY